MSGAGSRGSLAAILLLCTMFDEPRVREQRELLYSCTPGGKRKLERVSKTWRIFFLPVSGCMSGVASQWHLEVGVRRKAKK